jgi:hypothetical protein
MVLHQIIEKAQELKSKNDRLSTQADNQLPSVDAIIDDFVVEVQATTNILVQTSIYASIALAVTFITMQVAALFSAIFFWFSLGTVSNTSRYKNRNDEWRVQYFDDGFVKVGQAVFACMRKAARCKYGNDKSPFFIKLEKMKEIFVQNVHYYDLSEPVEFLKAFEALSMDINDPANIQTFMVNVATIHMADTYHVNGEYLLRRGGHVSHGDQQRSVLSGLVACRVAVRSPVHVQREARGVTRPGTHSVWVFQSEKLSSLACLHVVHVCMDVVMDHFPQVLEPRYCRLYDEACRC